MKPSREDLLREIKRLQVALAGEKRINARARRRETFLRAVCVQMNADFNNYSHWLSHIQPVAPGDLALFDRMMDARRPSLGTDPDGPARRLVPVRPEPVKPCRQTPKRRRTRA